MKDNVMITIASLLSIVLTTFHVTSDVALGIDKPGLGILFVLVPIVVFLLCGTLLLAGRRSGDMIVLGGSPLALAVAYLHLGSARMCERAIASGGYFFIWTLIAMSTTSLFSV